MEGALRRVDRLRGRVLRSLGRLGARLAVDRELRVGLTGALGIAAILLVSSAVPIWTLALGPVLLGVPHVLMDVRYLVARPGLHRRRALPWLAGLPLLGSALGGGLLAAALACAGALAAARASATRRAIGLCLVAALAVAVWDAGPIADVVFAHVHNLVAVLLWLMWRRRPDRRHAWPAAAFLAGGLAIAAGWTMPLLEATGQLWTFGAGVDPYRLAAGLAPGLGDPWASRLLVLFAFAQSTHYLMWLRLIPEEARPRPTVRTFVRSWRALRADLGPVLLTLAAAAALGVGAWAMVDLQGAREGYLRAAQLHGHLELVGLSLLLAEGRDALRGPAT